MRARAGMGARCVNVVGRSLATLALGMLLHLVCAGCVRDEPKYPVLSAREGVVTVEIAGIGAENGRFLTYRADSGKKVNFFVYRQSSGMPHAVLDACRTCYRWKRGYVLDGEEVVCLKCDMRFKLDSLAQGTGSCVPIALTTEQRGSTLVIPVAELEAGARFF